MWSSTSCILLGLTLCDTLVILTYAASLLYFGIKLILVFLEFKFTLDSKTYYVFGLGVTKNSVKWLDELQYCYLYPLNKSAYTGSVYATVLLTIERYIAVCWPLHSRRFLRPKTAIIAIFLVLSFAVLLNSPRWMEAQQYISEVDLSTYYDWDNIARTTLVFRRSTFGNGLLRYRSYREFYHGIAWNFFMYFLPISSLVVLNFKILKQLKLSKRNRAAMTLSASHRSNENRDQNAEDDQLASLTKMLLCVIMIFVICNTTSGVIVWALMLQGWEPTDIEIFSCIPLLINSSVNFIIYVLLGSKFRTELCRLTSILKRCIFRSDPNQSRNSALERNSIPLFSLFQIES